MLVIGAFFISLSSAEAFDVPSYIKDPQKISDNICVIIEQNTAARKNSQTAADLETKLNDTINEYAARLYAEALSIRTTLAAEGQNGQGGNMMGMAQQGLDMAGGMGGEAAQKAAGAVKQAAGLAKSLLGSSNKQEVLQNDVKPHIKSIALHLKQIVELETAIVNLQGIKMLAGMEDVGCKDETAEEDNDDAGEDEE